MGAGGVVVDECGGADAVLVGVQQQLHPVVCALHLHLLLALDVRLALHVVLEHPRRPVLEVLRLVVSEQVEDLLVVDLVAGDEDKVQALGRARLASGRGLRDGMLLLSHEAVDLVKDPPHHTQGNALALVLLHAAENGVRLARARAAVGDEHTVVAVEETLHVAGSGPLVDLWLLRVVVEHLCELVLVALVVTVAVGPRRLWCLCLHDTASNLLQRRLLLFLEIHRPNAEERADCLSLLLATLRSARRRCRSRRLCLAALCSRLLLAGLLHDNVLLRLCLALGFLLLRGSRASTAPRPRLRR
mmetsp:Transcript_3470/g.12218  ORF Transcript_3470/g.12218 Transcript_3470/m.12218 type:complete len:302 (-) Transcript_3470:159-1064(-)